MYGTHGIGNFDSPQGGTVRKSHNADPSDIVREIDRLKFRAVGKNVISHLAKPLSQPHLFQLTASPESVGFYFFHILRDCHSGNGSIVLKSTFTDHFYIRRNRHV